jgi:hypothetical protein
MGIKVGNPSSNTNDTVVEGIFRITSLFEEQGLLQKMALCEMELSESIMMVLRI